jgi:hypothetical protein
LLSVEPYVDYPVYVGFGVGDQEIGLVPYGQQEGATAFYHVDDPEKSSTSRGLRRVSFASG